MQHFWLDRIVAICNVDGMTASPSLCKRLSDMGISPSYASQLSRGVRKPGLPLALRIHREIGEKLAPSRAHHQRR